ncbi:phage protein NinX family protein [Providencia sp. wls1914]|uniref:phage protein NinX family protein n=1 Tax=Providencia sp. wls1914 TaxID=2675156 RepID=UPI0012B5488E|nr:phage protein NinX family protein [Providencia sp. wls1914]MTC72003.1 DUF2591 domain-containing protein [Providencia sp. wls1914]
MNKYTELSDFEINKIVAEELIQSGFIIDVEYSENYIFVADKYHKCYAFDPCNNTSNAMTIIIENRIAIFPMETLGCEYWCAASNFQDIVEKEIAWGLEANNKNPLRAAMELFLLMKDAENENNNNG